jgi:trimethylamine:corrinoid methyltransferase-like protein
MRGWQRGGSLDAFARAKIRTAELLGEYVRPPIVIEHESELTGIMRHHALAAGMQTLPVLI